MVKVLHSSDLHIKEKGDERWSTLETIIRKCKEENVDYLVLSGDVFHNSTVAHKNRQGLRGLFEEASFTTYIIPGNHDADCYPEDIYIGSNVHLLRKKPFTIKEEEQVRFIGLPYQDVSDERITDILLDIESEIDDEKTNLLLFHGDLVDVYSGADGGGEGNRTYMPMHLSYFNQSSISYVLAGHYHTDFIIRKYGAKDKNGYFVYPGSPVSTTKKETDKRCVNIFEVGGDPKSVPVDTAYYKRVSLKFTGIEENPLSKIKEKIQHKPKRTQYFELNGFISVPEKQFQKDLNTLKEEHSVEFKNRVRQLSHLTETNLYKSFMEKLEDDADVKEYFIRAALEVLE